jgi:hypothetical protein
LLLDAPALAAVALLAFGAAIVGIATIPGSAVAAWHRRRCIQALAFVAVDWHFAHRKELHK